MRLYIVIMYTVIFSITELKSEVYVIYAKASKSSNRPLVKKLFYLILVYSQSVINYMKLYIIL